MRTLLVLCSIALLVAGCAAPAGEEAPAAVADPSVTIDEARPDPTFADVKLTAALPDTAATLAAAPAWVPGEWWRYHFSSPLTGEDVEFVKVVAAVDGDVYVVGMPHEGWYKEAVVYHTPCFGDVRIEDLGCEAHNIPFLPVQFPLTDGATWTTQFERPPDLTATVKVDSPTQATITFTGPNGNVAIEEVYDATIHEVRSFTQATAVYEVIEHGYGFQGWITIPRAMHLVFEHGRLGAPVLSVKANPNDPDPANLAGPPQETVDVAGGYNRLSFIIAAGNIGLTPGDAGYYKETATAPDGTAYSIEATGPEGLKIEFLEAKDPDGTWNLEHLAAGPGIAFIEGIAYHQYDIQLPGGAIRSDHSHEVIR
ncbi:MAG TPA: hypothetical protein VM370_10580 [Candidatus Thermoplasmatota archaeon]|nr:hypothetical protein [Candidatus Thermoplasmatota archaeon]